MNRYLVFIFAIIVVILIFVLWQWSKKESLPQSFQEPGIEAPYDNLHYFDPNDFPHLVRLSQYSDVIAGEAKNITEISSVKRRQHEWTGFQDAENFFSQLGNNTAWFYSWDSSQQQDGKDNWLNYPLIYRGKIIGQAKEMCPETCQLLRKIPGINVAGFSRIKAGTRIYPHSDTTGLTTGTLAYHLGLIGEANLFVISSDGQHLHQHHEPGKVVIVNTNKKHYVENPYHEDRIILYIDFKLNLNDFRPCPEEE